MGESIRAPDELSAGDKVILVGKIGGEAVWLDKLSRGESSNMWREFTPLPVIFTLQDIRGVKLMHDVSEGGVKGALYEIVESNGHGLKTSSEDITLYPGAEKLPGDILRAPTYGALIVISESEAVELIHAKCSDLGLPCNVIGEVSSEPGLFFNSVLQKGQGRIGLDEIYGSLTRKKS
jgi:hydrogenase maturation factor